MSHPYPRLSLDTVTWNHFSSGKIDILLLLLITTNHLVIFLVLYYKVDHFLSWIIGLNLHGLSLLRSSLQSQPHDQPQSSFKGCSFKWLCLGMWQWIGFSAPLTQGQNPTWVFMDFRRISLRGFRKEGQREKTGLIPRGWHWRVVLSHSSDCAHLLQGVSIAVEGAMCKLRVNISYWPLLHQEVQIQAVLCVDSCNLYPLD